MRFLCLLAVCSTLGCSRGSPAPKAAEGFYGKIDKPASPAAAAAVSTAAAETREEARFRESVDRFCEEAIVLCRRMEASIDVPGSRGQLERVKDAHARIPDPPKGSEALRKRVENAFNQTVIEEASLEIEDLGRGSSRAAESRKAHVADTKKVRAELEEIRKLVER